MRPPLCVVYFLQHGGSLNRPSHIPKHAPHTPHAHPTHLFPGADKKLHDKATLLSVFQKCEEAMLNATDDCSDDAAGCRRTLELAKEIVEGMLGHARLEEVCLRGGRSLQLFFFVAACRGRLMPCHALPSPASAIGMGVRATDDATGWMYFFLCCCTHEKHVFLFVFVLLGGKGFCWFRAFFMYVPCVFALLRGGFLTFRSPGCFFVFGVFPHGTSRQTRGVCSCPQGK